MDHAMKLPATLDFRTAAPLRDALLERRGHPLRLDADEVERIGGQCIQVLVAAQQTWAHDGVAFSLHAPSDEMRRSLGYVGLQSFFTEASAS
ncbi:MAG: STAS domain-containing protein [Hyphomonadaceae bacterium]